MKKKAYSFRREDNGKVVKVPFEVMMTQDVAGYITLADGVSARRVDRPTMKRVVDKATGVAPPHVSDALGFPQQQLADFEADRQAHGFTSVEFKQDPRVPEFYQVHFHNKKEYQRYVEHRGMTDRNSRNGSGAMLSESLLERARKLVTREEE